MLRSNQHSALILSGKNCCDNWSFLASLILIVRPIIPLQLPTIAAARNECNDNNYPRSAEPAGLQFHTELHTTGYQGEITERLAESGFCRWWLLGGQLGIETERGQGWISSWRHNGLSRLVVSMSSCHNICHIPRRLIVAPATSRSYAQRKFLISMDIKPKGISSLEQTPSSLILEKV